MNSVDCSNCDGTGRREEDCPICKGAGCKDCGWTGSRHGAERYESLRRSEQALAEPMTEDQWAREQIRDERP